MSKKLLKKRKPAAEKAPAAIVGGDSPEIASTKVPKAADETAAPAGSP